VYTAVSTSERSDVTDELRIVDTCPGCSTRVEGPRTKVEQMMAWHRKACDDFQNYEAEQRLQIKLGQL
jgi:hypothetical protein